MSRYRAAAVEVIGDRHSDSGSIIVARLLEPERLWGPLAPATLVPLSGEWENVLELHRVVESNGDTYTFATSDERQVTVGSTLGLQPWWTADVLELVIDTAKEWHEGSFDDRTVRDYCPLCWTTLNQGEPAWTDDGNWICRACHSKYITDDYLGIRS